MELKRLIDSFVSDIYFKNTSYLKNSFINICEIFDKEYIINNDKDENEKNNIMKQLFSVFTTNDFIKMADYLQYTLKKIIR